MNTYTEEEAYELALVWMPKINSSMATNGQLINLASKIFKGELTTSDLEKLKNKKMETISQAEFWNLPEVKKQVEIQKKSQHNSYADFQAFAEIKRLVGLYMGEDFAQNYMGDY